MKKIYFFTSLLFSSTAFAQQPQLDWVKTNGGTGSAYGYQCIADANGNVYTVGYSTGVVDMDPGPGTLFTPSTKTGFMQKLDASGNMADLVLFPDVELNLVCLDKDKNLLVGGRFEGTVDLDPGTGVTSVSSPTGYYSICVIKLDDDGNFLWGKSIGGNKETYLSALVTDAGNNVYFGGLFTGTTDFDPGPATTTISIGTNDNGYVVKLTNAGDLVWYYNMTEGASIGNVKALAIDNQNRLLIMGIAAPMYDVNPGPGTFNLIATGLFDTFIVQLDASDNFSWAKSFSTTTASSMNQGTSLLIDEWNNIYATGYFKGTSDFDPGTGTASYTATAPGPFIFTLKLKGDGFLDWINTMSSGNGGFSQGIAPGPGGTVFCTGVFFNTVDLDPGTGTSNYTSAGLTDGYVQKFDSTGNLVWAAALQGDDYDYIRGISFNNSNLYLSGTFFGTTDFDPGLATQNISPGGFTGMFVSRWQTSFTGIDEKGQEPGFMLYPNPSTGNTNVFVPGYMRKAMLKVYDIQGNMVHSQTIEPGYLQLNLHIPNGIYLITVQNETHQFSSRWVKN